MSKHKTILESWSPFMAGRNDFSKNETLMKIAAKHGKSVVQTKVKISNTCHFERSDQAACKAQQNSYCHFELSHKAKNLHCHFE